MLVRLRRVLLALSFVMGVLLVTTTLWARAGGGEGYGGGGRSGGGGGGGDFGDILFLLVRLIIYYPKVGIPLTLVVIVIMIYVYRSGNYAYQGSVIRRGHAALSNQQHLRMVSSLRQADPAFDERAFLTRASEAFHKIQGAWSNQELAPVRPFISDAVHERFSLQFDEQRALGWRNVTDNVAVSDIRLSHVQSDAHFDTASVRIAATASDHKVRLADGSRIAGTDHSGPFVEVWSFLRRRGSKTTPGKAGLIEGNCPNCGAAIEMNQNASCGYCGALLRSGEHDWVLVEITQECEWSPNGSVNALPGVAAMIEKDPTFNVQDLEDRASVMFWRRAAAERTGSIKPLRKIASEPFVESAQASLRAARQQGKRGYYGECAVGSVDMLGVIPGDSTRGDGESERWDRALVEVRWSGKAFAVTSDDAPPRRTGDSTLSRFVFELSRQSGVKSEVNLAISSAHCPGCGAPEKGGTSPACEHCGITLNDGRHGWVLTAVRSPQEAQALLAPLRSAAMGMEHADGEEHDFEGDHDGNGDIELLDGEPTPAGVLAWMASIAVADGNVDPKEQQLLSRVAAKRNVPPVRLEALLDAARRKELDLPMPHNPQQSRQWLGAMASAALVDGNLSKDEYNLLLHTGSRLGMGEYDVKMLLRRTRTEALERARGALRAARRGNGA